MDAGSKAETELVEVVKIQIHVVILGNLGICLDANGSCIRVHWNCEKNLKSIFSSLR